MEMIEILNEHDLEKYVSAKTIRRIITTVISEAEKYLLENKGTMLPYLVGVFKLEDIETKIGNMNVWVEWDCKIHFKTVCDAGLKKVYIFEGFSPDTILDRYNMFNELINQ